MSSPIKNKENFIDSMEKRLVSGPEKRILRALTKSAMLVDTTAKMSILRGSKSGSTVTKYKPSRTHQQSAAGEAPASDTGYLANSISHEVIVDNKGTSKSYTAIVSASAEYAIHLEFGTVNMGARPFLHPALKENSKKIIGYFRKEGLIK